MGSDARKAARSERTGRALVSRHLDTATLTHHHRGALLSFFFGTILLLLLHHHSSISIFFFFYYYFFFFSSSSSAMILLFRHLCLSWLTLQNPNKPTENQDGYFTSSGLFSLLLWKLKPKPDRQTVCYGSSSLKQTEPSLQTGLYRFEGSV